MVGQAPQHAQPPGDHIIPRRHRLIRQRIAGREQQHRIGVEPLAQILAGAQCRLAAADDVQQRALCEPGQRRHDRRARRSQRRSDMQARRSLLTQRNRQRLNPLVIGQAA